MTLNWAFTVERVTGIEPASRAWESVYPCQVMSADLRVAYTSANRG
jgi:hypothetical protein